MAIVKQEMLIYTDAKNNNNKFYELILEDNDVVKTRWGRVGSAGQSSSSNGGLSYFNSVKHSKIAKGYEESKIVAVNNSNALISSSELSYVAKRDIITDKNDKKNNQLMSLIEKLSLINRHQISAASSGNITMDASGIITTPLGLVTKNTILEARKLLVDISKHIVKKDFSSTCYINKIESYLKLIPQKVPSKKGWYETIFKEEKLIIQQNGLLDQLESSVDLYETKKQEAIEKLKDLPSEEVFKTKLNLITDRSIIDKINSYYNESKNSIHASSHLKLKNVYEIKNCDWEERYKEKSKDIKNVQLLWHGTRAFNVLSIFKNGLIVPKSGGNYHITGRMFGDGVCFSDQSSKALNYSYGYWDSSKKDNNCYMFLAEVALGKSYVPSYANDRAYPVNGYDSVFAKANRSGVRNNEMIVYDIGQVNLKYLCEFE